MRTVQLPRKHAGLRSVAVAAGVAPAMIGAWAARGAISFRGVGRGHGRSYTLWQAIHLAIIAEMASLRLSIVGPGAVLSEGMMDYVRHQITGVGLDSVGRIALVPERGGLDWVIHPITDVSGDGSCIVLDLGRIVAGVSARWDELAPASPSGGLQGRTKRRSKLHPPNVPCARPDAA